MKHSLRHLMLLATMLFCITASAYDFEVDGIYYNIVSLSDLTCEVTAGDNKYTGDMVIPSTVTYKNRNLSVVSIGEEAFGQSSSLVGVTIPASINYIGYNAFSRNKLQKLVVEDGTNTLKLGSSYSSRLGSFYGNSIDTLYIGRDFSYEYTPFRNCPIKKLIIGKYVTQILASAFDGCRELTKLVIEDGDNPLEVGVVFRSSDLSFYGSSIDTLYIGRNLSYDGCDYSGHSPFASIKMQVQDRSANFAVWRKP